MSAFPRSLIAYPRRFPDDEAGAADVFVARCRDGFRRLHALAVADRRRPAGFATDALTVGDHQRMVDCLAKAGLFKIGLS